MQLACAAGARVFATAGGADKLALCRELGAEEAFDYRAGPWLEPFLERTGGRGADVVFDPVGGETTGLSVKALARNGRLLIVGFSGGEIQAIKAKSLLLKNASALGVYWSHDTDGALVERSIAEVLSLRAAGKVRLLVGWRYAFAELPRALEDLAARRTTGKSVILMEGGET
ncbi:MAG: zinc-binding dehydrogenase [Proteobacteria bacterium]|nr:zinc-binding dehydrogenase [Pseudomonadota bacterium]